MLLHEPQHIFGGFSCSPGKDATTSTKNEIESKDHERKSPRKYEGKNETDDELRSCNNIVTDPSLNKAKITGYK